MVQLADGSLTPVTIFHLPIQVLNSSKKPIDFKNIDKHH